MSVEALAATVGAVFFLVLLLMLLRDRCVETDHKESEF